MAQDSFKVKRSLNIEPIAGAAPTAEGDVTYDSTAHKASLHNGTSASPVVTEAHSQTLTNKTIAAGSNTLSGITNSHLSGSAAITNANLATMNAHTFKGNNSGSSATPSDLTTTQLTAELNAVVGDSGSGGTKGLVPAPASGDAAAGKFLKADGTWSTGGIGTVTSVAQTAPNSMSVSGSPVTSAGTIALSARTVPAAKTSSTYNINGATDYSLKFDATSNAITVTMPSPSTYTGQIYILTRIDNTLANAITISANSSETFGAGALSGLHMTTIGESWTLQSDGTNWMVLGHHTDTGWLNNDSIVTPASGAFGTVSAKKFFWRRTADTFYVRGYFKCGTTAGGTASFTFASGITINTSKYASTANVQQVGNFLSIATSGTPRLLDASDNNDVIMYDGSTNTSVYLGIQSASNAVSGVAGSTGFVSSDGCSFNFSFPATNWEA